jgi:hypothetical protein
MNVALFRRLMFVLSAVALTACAHHQDRGQVPSDKDASVYWKPRPALPDKSDWPLVPLPKHPGPNH